MISKEFFVYISGLTLLNIDENDRENWSYVDLSKADAQWLYENLKSTISNWRSFYNTNGISDSDMQYLENAFNHWDAL